jgi:hypothetical protein
MEHIIFLADNGNKIYESYTGASIDDSWQFLTLYQKTFIGQENRFFVSLDTLKQIIANAENRCEVKNDF